MSKKNVKVTNVPIQSLIWLCVSVLGLTSCESMGIEGGLGLGLGVVGGILVVAGLGWLAIKVLGGVIKIGLAGITLLVLVVIGLIVWAVISSMG